MSNRVVRCDNAVKVGQKKKLGKKDKKKVSADGESRRLRRRRRREIRRRPRRPHADAICRDAKTKKKTGKKKKTKLENPFAIGLSGSAEVTERKLGKTQ